MRVTNYRAMEGTIDRFTTSRTQLERALERISTGRRFNTASEDPMAALGVMQNAAQSRAIEQYRRNIGVAKARAALEEQTLDGLSSLLTRAKELAVAQAGDTANTDTRRATAAEANQLLAQAVQLANTKHQEEFLFGGATSLTRPYVIDTTGAVYDFTVAAPAPSGQRAVEITAGQFLVPTHDGTQVFGDDTTGVLAALRDLAAALSSGSGANVAAAIPGIDTVIQSTQSLVADVGARVSQMETTDAIHTASAIDLDAATSELRDIDIESAMTELVSRQTALEAAMAATSRILGLSLTEYLR